MATIQQSFVLNIAPCALTAVYDVTRRDTFDSLQTWLEEVEVYCPSNGKEVVKLLVANKIDKVSVIVRAMMPSIKVRQKGGARHGERLACVCVCVEP